MNNVEAIIKKWYAFLQFPKEYDAEFEDVLKRFDIDETLLEKTTAQIKEIDDNTITFLYSLVKCEELEKKYQREGIPKEVFSDTISDIKVWTVDYHERTGKIGLDQPEWIALHLDYTLFKLGRLQYSFKKATEECKEAGLKIGDNVIAIHIPRNEMLKPSICKESIAMAEKFLKKYFPKYEYSFYTCGSWLLSSDLEAMLDESSNILKFKGLFQIIKQDESDTMLSFVFPWGTEREDALKITAETSLQKKVQKYIAAGKPLHWGYGYIKRGW